METLCFKCSLNGTSCCKGTQIYLTNGDVLRISRFLGSRHFFAIEMADTAYLDPGDDPTWLALTIRPDGQRRVLKRTGDKSCTMLGEKGCRLPMPVRPLVCRLYPYEFTEKGISGVDSSCPISRERDWPALIEQLGMAMGATSKWHNMLYCELYSDNTTAPEKIAGRFFAVPDKLSA